MSITMLLWFSYWAYPFFVRNIQEEADYKVGPTLSTHGGDVGSKQSPGRGKAAKPKSSVTAPWRG